MSMLTAQLGVDENIIEIKNAFIYTKRLYDNVPSARYNSDKKVWEIDKKYVQSFIKEFDGEVFFKTPRWVLEGRPVPDYSKFYKIDKEIELPKLKIPLYDYQNFGARFLIDKIGKHGFAINADSCGTGKTCHAIAVMTYMSERNINKFLIIVKKSIKMQWAEEIEKFSYLGETYKICYTGDTPKKRQEAYDIAKNAEKSILIVNYHNFLNDTKLIGETYPEFVIIDEAHCVKARDGILNQNISSVTQRHPTLFLTGTPVMSRPEDIFGIVQMADPDYFGEWGEFKDRYLVQAFRRGFFSTQGVKHLNELHKKVQDVLIRRTEYEISVQMPETVTHNLYVNKSRTQEDILSIIGNDDRDMADAYDSYEELQKKNELSADDQEKMTMLQNRMKGMISIRQLAASDPLIFANPNSKMAKHYASFLPKNLSISPKTEAILDIVEDIIAAEEKVILFSKFVTVGAYYAGLIEKKMKQKVLMYTGRENSEERNQNIHFFRESEEYNILIGTDAMAEGLNLAQARHVINIDLPDTYAIYLQRIGRVRRVSSTYSNIVVHNVLTRGTVDENRMNKLMMDKDLDGALVDGCEAQKEALKNAMKA